MKCPKCNHRKAANKPCRKCNALKTRDYCRSIRGKLQHRYRTIVQRCARDGKELGFTREEFIQWGLSDPEYQRLHAQWVAKKYNAWYTPSVDRLDNSQGYIPGNVRWITWYDNFTKEYPGFGKPSDPDPMAEDGIPDWL